MVAHSSGKASKHTGQTSPAEMKSRSGAAPRMLASASPGSIAAPARLLAARREAAQWSSSPSATPSAAAAPCRRRGRPPQRSR